MDKWQGSFMFEDFCEFLTEYHEGKWETKNWHDEDVEGKIVRNHPVKFYITITECSSLSLKKYILYQFKQLSSGKDEILFAFDLYLKYNKKTKTIATQTDG